MQHDPPLFTEDAHSTVTARLDASTCHIDCVGQAGAEPPTHERDNPMADILFVGLIASLGALSWGLIELCDRLQETKS